MLRGFVCMHAMLDQVKAAWDQHAKGAASGGFSTIISEMDDFSEAVDAALNAVRATRQLGRHGSADVELADVIARRGSGL